MSERGKKGSRKERKIRRSEGEKEGTDGNRDRAREERARGVLREWRIRKGGEGNGGEGREGREGKEGEVNINDDSTLKCVIYGRQVGENALEGNFWKPDGNFKTFFLFLIKMLR